VVKRFGVGTLEGEVVEGFEEAMKSLGVDGMIALGRIKMQKNVRRRLKIEGCWYINTH